MEEDREVRDLTESEGNFRDRKGVLSDKK